MAVTKKIRHWFAVWAEHTIVDSMLVFILSIVFILSKQPTCMEFVYSNKPKEPQDKPLSHEAYAPTSELVGGDETQGPK